MGRNKQATQKSSSRYRLHFRKWHRRLGFLAAVFLLNLSITGLLLNHYQALSLHKNFISSSLLLNWYGVKAPQSASCLSQQDLQICQIGEQYFINGNYWMESSSNTLLLQDSPLGVTFVTNDAIYWLTDSGQLIDSMSITDSVASAATAATIHKQTLYIETVNGFYYFDDEIFGLKQTDAQIALLKPTKIELKDEALSMLQDRYRSRQITQLKLVQDLHSGVIFGLTGTLFTDISALILIWLVISGFVTWYRRRSKTGS